MMKKAMHKQFLLLEKNDSSQLSQLTQKLYELEKKLHDLKLTDCAAQVKTSLNILQFPNITLTFGGHFKAGKSTLINALIERDLLPYSDLPETGAICTLKYGVTETALLKTETGVRTIACNTDAIRTAVSILQNDGSTNQAIYENTEVDLTLNAPIPTNVFWVDSPGINDSVLMTKRATVAAQKADVLIWVLNSRQFLSITEQNFVAEIVKQKGPAAIVFIINAWLKADTDAEWKVFTEQTMLVHVNKLNDCAVEMGFNEKNPPYYIVVSGRALSLRKPGFGKQEIQALLSALSDKDHSYIQRSRLMRITPMLQTLHTDLCERFKFISDAYQVWQRSSLFMADVQAINQNCYQTWVQAMNWQAQELISQISHGNLSHNNIYSNVMNQQVAKATSDWGMKLAAELRKIAHKYQFAVRDNVSSAYINQTLQINDITINIANREINKLVVGSVVFLGFVFSPLWGALSLIGGAIGGKIAADDAKKHTIKNIQNAIQTAIYEISQKQASVIQLIFQAYDLKPETTQQAPFLTEYLQQFDVVANLAKVCTCGAQKLAFGLENT